MQTSKKVVTTVVRAVALMALGSHAGHCAVDTFLGIPIPHSRWIKIYSFLFGVK